MERSNYFNDEDVYADDLNNTESTKAHQLVLRTQAPLGYSGGYSLSSASIYQGGIYGSPADYLLNKNFYCSNVVPGGSVLTVYNGTALSPTGDIIVQSVLPEGYITFALGTSGSVWNWTVTPNVLNYIKLSYQETSGSVGVDDLGNVFASEYYASYMLTVDGNPANPATQILLATFIADGSGKILTGLTDCRTYVSTVTLATSVMLDPTTKLVSTFTTVADHVNAKGSGTATAKNAHGLTLADLGASDGTVGHRVEAHAACIIDITGAYPAGVFFNSWQPSMSGSSGSGPTITIQFAAGATNAAILAGGNVYPGLVIPNQPLVGNPLFPVTSTPTQYWLYIDSTGTIRSTTTALSDVNNRLTYTTPDIFVLCTISISNGGVDYFGFADLRRFYPNMPAKIQADFFDTYSQGNFPALSNSSTLLTSLQRIRWQLGMSIDGSGADWTVTPPLTAGGTSVADIYHTHTQTPNAGFTVNAGSTPANNPNPGYFIQVTSTVQAAMQWVTAANALIFYSNASLTTLATGSFGAINIGSTLINAVSASNLINVLEGGALSDASSLHTHSTIPQFKNITPTTGTASTGVMSSWEVNGNVTAMFINIQATAISGGILGSGTNDFGITIYWSALGHTDGSNSVAICSAYMPAQATGAELSVNTSFLIPVGASWAYKLTTTNTALPLCTVNITHFD
jgi:hypothetical protein